MDALPVIEGGTCHTGCWDDHEYVVMPGDPWEEYVVAFADLAQSGWGTAADFDATRVRAIRFQTDPLAPIDFWIDDLGFY